MNAAKEIIINQQETILLSQQIAKNIKQGDVITLHGDLGSGKTFLCRHIIQHLCKMHVNVISPTFNILQTYKCNNYMIYHFDLYRVTNTNELYELGIEDALDNVCLIEWPNIGADIFPKASLEVHLKIKSDDLRICQLFSPK